MRRTSPYEGYILRVLDMIRSNDGAMTKSEVTKKCRGNTNLLVAAVNEAIDDGLLDVKKQHQNANGRPSAMLVITARGRQVHKRALQRDIVIVNEKVVQPQFAFESTYTEDDFLRIMNVKISEDDAYAYASYAESIGDVLLAKYDELALVSVQEFLNDTAPTYWADKEKSDIVKMMYAAQYCTNPARVVNVIEGDGVWRISASDYTIQRLRTLGDRWAYKRWAKELYATWRFN